MCSGFFSSLRRVCGIRLHEDQSQLLWGGLHGVSTEASLLGAWVGGGGEGRANGWGWCVWHMCMCLGLRECTYVCSYFCVCVFFWMWVFFYVCVYISVCVCMHVCVRGYVCMLCETKSHKIFPLIKTFSHMKICRVPKKRNKCIQLNMIIRGLALRIFPSSQPGENV